MLVRLALCVASLPVLGGCATEGGSEPEPEGPTLHALSRDEVRVGQRLELLGEALADGVSVRFDGEFAAADGSIHRVDLGLRPERVGEDRLVIPYFGPYQVPFGDGDQVGTFTGTVAASAGDVEGPPLDVELRVAPGIIVRALASEDRLCDAPSTLLIGGGTLHIVAEAIGFEASGLDVRLGEAAPVAAVDGVADLPIPEVAAGTLFAVTDLAITARDADGTVLVSEYLIGVHRALEYVRAGGPQDVQIEEALPLSGCISGGTEGQTLTFGDADVDLRPRALHFSWNQDWLDEHGQIAQPEAVAEVGLRRVVDGPGVGPDTDTWTVGYADSERTDAAALVPGPGGIWQASSAAMLAGATGEIPEHEYGVWYRQAIRIVHPGALVDRNACGEPTVIADSMLVDYRWEADLATAPECPPLPPSNLPPSQCLLPPCD